MCGPPQRCQDLCGRICGRVHKEFQKTREVNFFKHISWVAWHEFFSYYSVFSQHLRWNEQEFFAQGEHTLLEVTQHPLPRSHASPWFTFANIWFPNMETISARVLYLHCTHTYTCAACSFPLCTPVTIHSINITVLNSVSSFLSLWLRKFMQ